MNLVIRPILSSDRNKWQELYYSYLDFYESKPNEKATEILFSRLTSTPAQIQGLVAELEGQIVGIAHYHFQLSTWTHTTHCYLEDLFVVPEARGSGIATKLIEAVRDASLENKCSELFWITKESNQTARKVYDRLAKLSDFVRYEILLES